MMQGAGATSTATATSGLDGWRWRQRQRRMGGGGGQQQQLPWGQYPGGQQGDGYQSPDPHIVYSPDDQTIYGDD